MRLLRRFLRKEEPSETKCPRCGVAAPTGSLECTACGWDCEGYAEAIAKGETKDLTLCVPGEAETESMLVQLMAAGGNA